MVTAALWSDVDGDGWTDLLIAREWGEIGYFRNNAGRGFEMEDLLATADVLVTDYSSVMFDFAVLERPMVFLVPDLEQYRDTLRGFYFDFEAEAPGPLVTTTAELVAAVSDEPGLRGHLPAVRAFRERFCPLDDGAAAGRVVDELQRRGVLPRG